MMSSLTSILQSLKQGHSLVQQSVEVFLASFPLEQWEAQFREMAGQFQQLLQKSPIDDILFVQIQRFLRYEASLQEVKDPVNKIYFACQCFQCLVEMLWLCEAKLDRLARDKGGV